MTRRFLSVCVAFSAAFTSLPAYAALTVHTTGFINAPVSATGFEDVVGQPAFNSPLVTGGVSVRYVWAGAPSGTCCVFGGVFDLGNGQQGWYSNEYLGHTSIKLADGTAFNQIQFLAGSGIGPESGSLNYRILLEGNEIATGVAGQLDDFTRLAARTYGFSGMDFDEVQLWNPALGTDLDGLGLDDIVIGRVNAVPEPATWALMLGGFGLAGAALRRKSPSNAHAA